MKDRHAVLLLIAAFLLAVIAVDPRGNFPLNDDWGVGFTTFTLLQTGTIEFTPFASATAYLQFAWGALWAALFGPSFTALRCATLTLSLGATLLAYALLRSAKVAVGLAVFGAAALLFHPLFFWASFTSMTHIPYVFTSLLAAWLFVRAWDREGVWLLLAFVACVASFFTRQFGILNALAPLTVALIYRRRNIALTYALATLVFGTLVLGGVLVASQKELALHRPSAAGLLMRAAHYIFFNWQNAALFFAPALLLALFARGRIRLSRPVMIASALLFGYAAVRMTSIGLPIPYMNSGNVFTNFGLGPPTLRDVFTLRMPHPFALPESARIALMILTTVAAIAAAGLAAAAIRVDDVLTRYCVAYLTFGTVFVAFMRINFDRYSIDTAWPFGILLMLLVPSGQRPVTGVVSDRLSVVGTSSPVGGDNRQLTTDNAPSSATLTRTSKAAAAAMLALFILFSIAGTAEYLAWNRARWDAYAFLRAGKIPLEWMDAGYEVNSMLALRAGRKDLGKPGVGVVDDRYILTFNERVPGYRHVQAFPYRRWFGLSEGAVHIQWRR